MSLAQVLMYKLTPPIPINRPMALIPAEEYQELLAKASYAPTPKLDRAIAKARRHFKTGKVIPGRFSSVPSVK